MRVVCVTGMHRSGTSLTSRVLNLLGVWLGPEEGMMAGAADNPRGFWESRTVQRLNDAVLQTMGGSWNDPPALEPGWERDQRLDDLRRQATESLREVFDVRELVGWKDPRTSLTLPFWRSVVKVDATLLMLRAPEEVARSLTMRNGFHPEHSAALWCRYVAAAWLNDPACLILRYGDFFDDLDRTVDRIVDHAGLEPPTAEQRGEISAFFEPELRHYESDDVADGPAMRTARLLFAMLPTAPHEQLHPFLSALAGAWTAERQRRDTDARVTELTAQVSEHAQELEKIRLYATGLQTERAELRGQVQKSRAALDDQAATVQRLEERVADRERELAAAQDRTNDHQRQRREAEERYTRLRTRRGVRLALRASEQARPAISVALRARAAVRRRSGRPTGAAPPVASLGAAMPAATRPTDGSTGRPGGTAGAGAARTAPAAAARVFAIVLNYRHPEDTLRCIDSLSRSTHRNLYPVVVDNGSDEQDLATLRAGLGALPLLHNPANLGYAAGNNVGLRYALDRDADFLWILNPDMVVDDATLPTLLATMDAVPDAGIVGGRVLYGGAVPPKIWFNGGVVDLSRGGATHHLDDGLEDAALEDLSLRSVDYVTGANMLVRRAVLEDVGFLPEEWFLYFEETAFNIDVRRHGWKILVDPSAKAEHYKRSTSGLPSPYYVYYYVRNRIVFGQRVSDLAADDLIRDLDPWVQAWRTKVRRRAPDWLGTYEQLLTWAVADGRAGRTGRRDDVHALERSGGLAR